MKGLIHIYTGNGKGKTTSAIGLGIRAYGNGHSVYMVQFLKGWQTGELEVIKKLSTKFKFNRGIPSNKFIWDMNQEELAELKENTQSLFNDIVGSVHLYQWDLLILDEIVGAITNKLLDLEDVIDFLNDKPDELEVVLTGRNAPKELIEIADYVSEIKEIKHPHTKGISARKGIEF